MEQHLCSSRLALSKDFSIQNTIYGYTLKDLGPTQGWKVVTVHLCAEGIKRFLECWEPNAKTWL